MTPRLHLHRRLLALCVLVVAVLVPATAQAATPGINLSGNDPRRIAQALQTDAKLVRFFVEWSTLQPAQGDGYPSKDPGAATLANDVDSAIKQVNAGGAKPIFVILGTPAWANGSSDQFVPPTDPQDYATFIARFVRHTRAVGQIAAYEIWNEQDEDGFWHAPNPPDATRYAALLKMTYAAAKPVAGDTPILVGALTGNNAGYLEQLYALGAKGSFDGVAVHTDTACLSLGPDFYYREDPGARLGRYTFLGYRSVRQVMQANDDLKPIWMTELGWSSTNGGPTSCTRGAGAGRRADGVSEAVQAQFLAQAYGCLARDPYVVAGFWFTMFNDPRQTPREIGNYGLIRDDGTRKPSYAAFKAVTAAGGSTVAPCGDFTPPTVSFVTPSAGAGFAKSLLIRATATDTADEGVTPSGLMRIAYSVDGKDPFYRFGELKNGDTVELDWLRAGELSDGEHTLTAEASDALGNVARTSIKIFRGAQYASRTTFTPTFRFPARGKNPSCRGRTCRFKGVLVAPSGVSVGGRVRVEWQFFSRQRVRSLVPGKRRYVSKWVVFHKGGASAKKPFTFTQKLKKRGRWRVRVTYDGALPLKKAASPYKVFAV